MCTEAGIHTHTHTDRDRQTGTYTEGGTHANRGRHACGQRQARTYADRDTLVGSVMERFFLAQAFYEPASQARHSMEDDLDRNLKFIHCTRDNLPTPHGHRGFKKSPSTTSAGRPVFQQHPNDGCIVKSQTTSRI